MMPQAQRRLTNIQPTHLLVPQFHRVAPSDTIYAIIFKVVPKAVTPQFVSISKNASQGVAGPATGFYKVSVHGRIARLLPVCRVFS